MLGGTGQAEELIEGGRANRMVVRDLVHATVALGDFDRADSLADRVPGLSDRATAQADLVDACVLHGAAEPAEHLARGIGTGRERPGRI